MLRVSDNNRAETVLNGFTDAVEEWGLPSRLRTDCGGENILIAAYMNMKRGPEAGCGPWFVDRW